MKTLAQGFSCEFCKISKSIFLAEHVWATASKTSIYINKFSIFFTVIIIYQESLIKEIHISLMLPISVFPNLLIYFRIQVKLLIWSKLIRLYYTYTLIWESIARQKIRKIFKHSGITQEEQFCYAMKPPNSRHALNSG